MTLVKLDKKDPVVSLNDISQFSGVKYNSIRDSMVRNKDTFKLVDLSLPKESDFKSVVLNEQQASLLLMFMKNTPQVKAFKIKLIKDFFHMRELLNMGVSIPDEFKVRYDQFVPKDGFNKENKKGMLKTKAVSGYYKADPRDPLNIALNKEHQLIRRSNALFQEEIQLELELVRCEIQTLKSL